MVADASSRAEALEMVPVRNEAERPITVMAALHGRLLPKVTR